MCSIPGLPTPGSEVPVLITRVNINPNYGLVELWVNIDDGRKHIYAQMKEEIQIPQRLFCGPEGNPGDVCLVYIKDTWHRARIVSIQIETYNVYLIDLGEPYIATSEALAWGQSDCFLLPPEIESCILANVLSFQNEWPERATKFLTCLPEKSFMGRVQHVLMPERIILLEIPLISKQLSKLGAAKKVDDFKILVQKCLQGVKGEGVSSETSCSTQEENLDVSCKLSKCDQYLSPELLTDTFEMVTVTEVVDPQNIFCKLLILSKALKQLSEQIQQYYEENADLGEAKRLSCRDPCAARGLDGRWHRSLLKQNILTCDGTVEVVHVDEGKAELVNVGDIRPLLGRFLRMPVVTYPCSLNGVKANRDWTADDIDFLKSLLLHQTVVAKFNSFNKPQETHYVTLYANNAECINKIFLDKAGFNESSKPEWDLNVQSETSSPISVGDQVILGVINATNGLSEDSTKSQEVNGRAGDTSTSSMEETDFSESCKVHDPPSCNGHLATELQSGYDNDVFAVGKSVNVKISCIESPQRFWCQTIESGHSLRRLMEDLQYHYASVHPQPLVECVCVARNPDNGMWYRVKIIASQHSPTVDVRFIDYGQTQKVPLQDLRPIDPAFLRLHALAFQCRLFSPENPNNPSPASPTDAAFAEFKKFVDLGCSSGAGLKCIIKEATTDEDGLLLNVVDLESGSESASKLLAQKCAQPETRIPSDAYNYSTHNIEVGGIEKVLVTSSESVSHFYCQLCRNSPFFDEIMKNVATLLDHPQSSDLPLGLNSLCLAKFTDNQWYRGQVVQMSPNLKVHFVDYGDTLDVCETDVRALPSEESSIRSLPVQAIPLQLFGIPAELPQEVNEWFADHAVGNNFAISVVAKGEKGKLFVELFDGSINVNMLVKAKVAEMKPQKTTGLNQQKDQQLPNSPETVALTNEDFSVQEPMKGTYPTHKASTPASECPMTLNEEKKPALNVETEAETSIQGSHRKSDITLCSPCSSTEGNGSASYTWPDISGNILEVYASCIASPHYFWCQYSNTENLNLVSKLAQEQGQKQDATSPGMLIPGTPCLALYSGDNQWYRAQVLQKTNNALLVLFVDYGNESEVDIDNVRSLPQSLLDMPPQAFLCCLNDFNESKGSWDDKVYDDFHNLLIDKLLNLAVLGVETHSETAVPLYKVKTECDGVVINDIMQKYWSSFCAEHFEAAQTEILPQDIQTEAKKTHFDASTKTLSPGMCSDFEMAKDETVMVYASCIAEPNYFWCQLTNTEDLKKVSRLAQEEARRAPQDSSFPKTLEPGSPCLALFSNDNQWHRAQVIKQAGKTLSVLFIDYGNESEVDVKNVRPLPQSLMKIPPQAFLCRLNGFDASNGSWDEEVYDDFYNLLVDKLLRLRVCDVGVHPEVAVPQFAVEMEREGVIVNAVMEKYWKAEETDGTLAESCR